MSTLKADAVTSAQDNTALTLSGTGTGGVKVNDFLIQTKGDDIASGTTLTLGKDGNQFDVTGTTTITSIATQGIGSIVTLHFDGALTFTHHSTNLILPGAANITTAAGDIAVMYEYASADWRCVSYTKASGVAVVVAAAGGFTLGTEQATASGTSITFSGIPSGTTMIVIMFEEFSFSTGVGLDITIGDAGGLETAGYISCASNANGLDYTSTSAFDTGFDDGAGKSDGHVILTLKDSSNFTWVASYDFGSTNNSWLGGGVKSLSAELTQLSLSGGTFDFGSVNIMYQ
jgi:hypothetical protein